MPNFPSSHIWSLREHRDRSLGDLAFPTADSANGIWKLKETLDYLSAGGGGGGGAAANPGSAYATSYLVTTGGTLYTKTGGGSIDAEIVTMVDGDALVLGAGTYSVTATASESYSSSLFRNRNILIAGDTTAADVILEITHGTQRGKHIFSKNSNITNTINQQLAFMQVKRIANSETNYINALSGGVDGSVSKGRMVNCYFNNNAGAISWIYDNTNSANTDVEFVRCTIGNYVSWYNKYSGNAAGTTVDACIFSGTTQFNDVTQAGTSYTGITVDASTGAYDNATYSEAGHLYVPNTTAVF